MLVIGSIASNSRNIKESAIKKGLETNPQVKPDISDTTAAMDGVLPAGYVAIATIGAPTEGGLTQVALSTSEHEASIECLAFSQQAYGPQDVGKSVACSRVHGTDHLMILGLMHTPPTASQAMLEQMFDAYQAPQSTHNDQEVFGELPEHDYQHDDERAEQPEQEDLVFSAEKSITFACGDSSIQLNADGQVLIRGKYVTNRAQKINRITGGSVKIN